MTNSTLKLDFTQACLVERALKNEMKSIYKWYRKLQALKAEGKEISSAHFENQRFFFSELNKQRRQLSSETQV